MILLSSIRRFPIANSLGPANSGRSGIAPANGVINFSSSSDLARARRPQTLQSMSWIPTIESTLEEAQNRCQHARMGDGIGHGKNTRAYDEVQGERKCRYLRCHRLDSPGSAPSLHFLFSFFFSFFFFFFFFLFLFLFLFFCRLTAPVFCQVFERC